MVLSTLTPLSLSSTLTATDNTKDMSQWMTSGASRLRSKQNRSFAARAQSRSNASSLSIRNTSRIPQKRQGGRRIRMAGMLLLSCCMYLERKHENDLDFWRDHPLTPRTSCSPKSKQLVKQLQRNHPSLSTELQVMEYPLHWTAMLFLRLPFLVHCAPWLPSNNKAITRPWLIAPTTTTTTTRRLTCFLLLEEPCQHHEIPSVLLLLLLVVFSMTIPLKLPCKQSRRRDREVKACRQVHCLVVAVHVFPNIPLHSLLQVFPSRVTRLCVSWQPTKMVPLLRHRPFLK